MPLQDYRVQSRGGKGVKGVTTKAEDEIALLTITNTHRTLYLFTSLGRVFGVRGFSLPEPKTGKGKLVGTIVTLEKEERVVAIKDSSLDGAKYVFFVTCKGTAKRLPVEELEGVGGMRLDDGDSVVGCDVVTEGRQVFFISEQGIGKRTKYSEFTQHHRAGYGVRAMKLSNKTGKLVGAWGVADDQEIVVISSKGRMVRINTNEVSSLSRTATGYKVVRLDDGDFVADVSIIRTEGEGELD
jgi:DNA gyrase subunit A